MQTIVVLTIVAVAAIILFKSLKRDHKEPILYDENFNDGYVAPSQEKPEKEKPL